MQLKLIIDGEEKTFTNDFVKGRVFRNALALNKSLKNVSDISVELFDNMVEFVVIAFDKQFSIDEFWDGVEANKLQDEVMRVFNGVLNLGGFAVQGEEQNEQGNETGK